MGMRLEICIDTLAGLDVAIGAGADRIELCSALALGGLTPSAGLMDAASRVDVPVRAMIRPRQGDFVYTPAEIDVMCHDIEAVGAHRLEGVVIGANLASGELDEQTLRILVETAKASGLKTTLHRSFDLVGAPLQALELAIGIGIDAILTSGGAVTATLGMANIQTIVDAARGRIEIMAGSGISAMNVAELVHRTGVASIHASCGVNVPVSKSKSLDLGFIRPTQRLTDADAVRSLRQNINIIQSATA